MDEELNPITEIDVEHIREVLGYIYANNRRTTKLVRGCSNVGGGVDTLFDCGDLSCLSCTNVREAFKKEIDKQLENL